MGQKIHPTGFRLSVNAENPAYVIQTLNEVKSRFLNGIAEIVPEILTLG